ncbi:MAG: RNA-binding protein, partial [archaeon]
MEKLETTQVLKNDIVRQNVRLGKRLDDRSFLSYRKLEIIPGYISKAEGSCLVKLGNTKVLAGV